MRKSNTPAVYAPAEMAPDMLMAIRKTSLGEDFAGGGVAVVRSLIKRSEVRQRAPQR